MLMGCRLRLHRSSVPVYCFKCICQVSNVVVTLFIRIADYAENTEDAESAIAYLKVTFTSSLMNGDVSKISFPYAQRSLCNP